MRYQSVGVTKNKDTVSVTVSTESTVVDTEGVNKAVHDLELIKSCRERLLRLNNYEEDSTVSFFKATFNYLKGGKVQFCPHL